VRQIRPICRRRKAMISEPTAQRRGVRIAAAAASRWLADQG
jgi:hypothetical protein